VFFVSADSKGVATGISVSADSEGVINLLDATVTRGLGSADSKGVAQAFCL
jgi:hypothetical protein